jgi:hypothetical protein
VWWWEGNNLLVGADAAIASPPIVDLTLCSTSQFVQCSSDHSLLGFSFSGTSLFFPSGSLPNKGV